MKLIIDELNEGERIDSYLAEIMPNVSRSKIQKWIKEGGVGVNDKKVKPSYSLKISDIIEVTELTTEAAELLPEDLPLEIVWEDENMAVINKPSGMLTHPTTIEKSSTLVNALLNKYRENLSDLNGEMRRGIVHRLDRNTSGLIMIAKNNRTHEFLVNEMKEHKFVKKYIAIVKGVVEKDEFEIDLPIGRNPNQPHKMMALPTPTITPSCVCSTLPEIRPSNSVAAGSFSLSGSASRRPSTNPLLAGEGTTFKPSRTGVKVLERLNGATLVELTLYTGRTHQIRVHMSSIGHPVYNDTLYGFGKMKIKTEEQVLQSYKLEFTKPFTQERISLEIKPDEKIEKVLKFCQG